MSLVGVEGRHFFALCFKAQAPSQNRCFQAQAKAPSGQTPTLLVQSQGADTRVVTHSERQIWPKIPKIPVFLVLIAGNDPLIGQNDDSFFKI
jgi:hypothetical protein